MYILVEKRQDFRSPAIQVFHKKYPTLQKDTGVEVENDA